MAARGADHSEELLPHRDEAAQDLRRTVTQLAHFPGLEPHAAALITVVERQLLLLRRAELVHPNACADRALQALSILRH